MIALKPPAATLPLAGRAGEGGARFLRAFVLAVAAVFALGLPALAREEIRSFDSQVTLDENGSVDVVETLVVNVEGDNIRHGIYRDIPTILSNADKSRLRSDLKVIDVELDGRSEPYSIENIGGGFKRIQIGDADVWLDNRLYTYTIHYTMSRMGRFFDDHDELFWNATGNYWAFPIVAATATLTLPPTAKISATIGYTGPAGSTEQMVTIARPKPNVATFKSTRELAAGEGMSVAVQFQKGVLVMPTGTAGFVNWLSDHRDLVFPSLGVILVLLYNLFAWNKVGRDPRKGTIIPLFHPPEGLSPAQVHYIDHMGFDKSGWTAFTASIFNLGVKGLVTIDKAGGKTSIIATKANADQKLPVGEQDVFDLVHASGKITIDKTDGPRLDKKRTAMISELKAESGETYFRNNVPYTIGGGVLAAILLGAMVLFDVLDAGMLVVAVVGAIVVGVLFGVFTGQRGGNIVGRIIALVWLGIIGVNVIGGSLSFLSGINIDTGLIAAVSIVVIEVVFAILMRAPTVAGRKFMDQIDGFKMYLNTAEKNRLNYVDKGEPQMTVKRFEAILPFAIALGVEKPWSDRFEADLSRNAVADAVAGYSPIWYSGGNWASSSSGFSNAVSSVATGMSAAMIAAQPSSSSGSGFSGGGGGGSGGGGGGGGGGGW